MFCTGSPFGPKTEPEVVMFEYRPEKPEQPVRMAAASNRSVVTFFIIILVFSVTIQTILNPAAKLLLFFELCKFLTYSVRFLGVL